MNEDGTPIEDGEEVVAKKQGRAAGADEGQQDTATPDEVAAMYKELGIKAPAPTGKTKGRPKTSGVRAKDGDEDDAGDTDTKSKQGTKNADDKSKSKDAPDSDKDGGTGDDSDAKSKKVSPKDGEVSKTSKKSDEGVHDTESGDEKPTKSGREGDADEGAEGARSEAHDEDDAEKKGEDDEGKRRGKSNPEVERRFQKLTSDVREKEAAIAEQNNRIKELEEKLSETSRKQAEAKVAQEDPEYTLEDFRKVKNSEGEVLELDENQAELAWRRWKDGYDQRSEQRNAEVNRQAAFEKAQAETEDRMMKESVEAYDTLTSLMDEYPELVEGSGEYDDDFAKKVMPLIHKTMIYQEGTEPGNEEGVKPVVLGLKLNPKDILATLKDVRNEKRSLPLNGVNDTVDARSNVNVPHSRSSDPIVNAANELYKSLNINKRF